MRNGYAWAAFIVAGLCLVASVAWPLWSDSDLWGLGFGAVAAMVLLPVVFGPSIRAVRGALEPRIGDSERD